MADIQNFLNDGANPYAKALLALLQRVEHSNPDLFLGVNILRWSQGFNQGYVLTKVLDNGNQVTIVFFDYPLSDTKISIWYRLTTQKIDPCADTDSFLHDFCYIDDLFPLDKLTQARDLILEYLSVIQG